MKIQNIFYEDCILINENFSTKDEVLRKIAETAKSNSPLKENNEISKENIYKALKRREELSSTGFKDGIAIPHCSLDIDDFIVGAVTSQEGVDFKSVDGKAAKLFIFIIAPHSKRNDHIRLLSLISAGLRVKGSKDELLASESPQAFKESFLRHVHIDVESSDKKEFNLVHVFIQREELFEDILGIFTEMPDCYLSVIEGHDAKQYLNALPLFSSFWSDEEKGYNMIITAIIKKSMANDTVRRVNALVEDSGVKTGILTVLQDTVYVHGSLNI